MPLFTVKLTQTAGFTFKSHYVSIQLTLPKYLCINALGVPYSLLVAVKNLSLIWSWISPDLTLKWL